MALLEAQSLSHSFDYPLFENINFKLEKKESIAVVGVSGSGKSTILHICASLLKPNSGEVFLEDKNLYGLSKKHLTQTRSNDIGIIFQSHFLFKGFNVNENIEIATILANTQIDKNLLERLGIASILKKKVGDISGGQQQRVSIARVLSKKPKIIFADEPTGNLDGVTAKEVTQVLQEYLVENNAAMFLVTHDLQLANLCDRAYRLEDLKLKQFK